MKLRINKRIFAPLAFVSAALFAAACDSPSEPTSPVGTYVLATLDGNAIPAVMFEGEGYSLSMIDGTLEVEADMSFVLVRTQLEIVDVIESEFTDSLRGTWTMDAMNALQFTVEAPDNSVFPGSWQGRNVTVLLSDGAPSSLVFQRR